MPHAGRAVQLPLRLARARVTRSTARAMPEGRIIAVTGLQREARILSGAGVLAIAGGGDCARLEALLEAACEGAAGVISIGLGGALAPELKPGDWVVDEGGDADWGR